MYVPDADETRVEDLTFASVGRVPRQGRWLLVMRSTEIAIFASRED